MTELARLGRRIDRGPVAGALTSVVLVALVTAAIALLQDHVAVLGLAVLYLFAVLPVSVVWGSWFGVGTAVLSMLSFNFWFLPPLHTLRLADSSNWVALVVFVVTAVVVSELAARARRRAAESALLAEMASSLLAPDVDLAAEAARVLGAERVRIVPGAPEPGGAGHRLAIGDRVVGTMFLEQPDPARAAARRRLLPAVSTLAATALDREQLQQEALEAEALRRSDALKTALLRSVSHDLRSPLMAILTSSSALSAGEIDLDADDRRELAGHHHQRSRPARPAGVRPARPVPAAGRCSATARRAVAGGRSGGGSARRAWSWMPTGCRSSCPIRRSPCGWMPSRSSACW